MSKYDFEIDLSQNSSTGMILSRINEGSVVLEFGCAAGRMTRYMKEALGCKVYIVEYDKSAFEKALQYAEDGLCDDILTFQWVEKFKGINFDAVIFADVLEHLTESEKVLKEASKCLKDAGYIYVSIPNITHNDIVFKAYDERFDYTSTGILDDTHVHFWGLKNLEDLAAKSDLVLKRIEATYCPVGMTEQYAEEKVNKHILFQNMLRERQCGEVYQFVLTFAKDGKDDTEFLLKTPSISSHMYLDTGNGFNAEEIVSFESKYMGQGSYFANCVINHTEKIKSIRFDPVEFQGCILREVSLIQGENKLHPTYQNALELDEEVLLLSDDPMVLAEADGSGEAIKVTAKIVLSGQEYLQKVEKYWVEKSALVSDVQAQLNGLEEQFKGLLIEKSELEKTLDFLEKEYGGLQENYNRLVDENEILRRDNCSYMILVNNKDKYTLEVKRELNAKRQNIAELELTLKNLGAELNYYKNLRVVRVRALLVRIVKGVLRRLKRVLGKEAR